MHTPLWKLRARTLLLDHVPLLSATWDSLLILRATRRWRRTGWENPPPYPIKRATLRAEARRIHARTFIESGTFLGDTPKALSDLFGDLYTIEIAPALVTLARRRFRKNPNIHVVEGDSSETLAGILRDAAPPYLFWLDGHYSGLFTGRGSLDCPLLRELAAIADFVVPGRDSILIDDARLFGRDPGYPTVEAVREFVAERLPGFVVSVENDMIVLHGKSSVLSATEPPPFVGVPASPIG